MKEYFGPIWSAKDTSEVCVALEQALGSLRAVNFFDEMPEYYQEMTAASPDDVQAWFDDMRVDGLIEEEGALKGIYDLYQAALVKLREFDFHRED